MELKPVKLGRNRYCGPGAVSAITGLDTDAAARAIKAAAPNVAATAEEIKGTGLGDMIDTFRHLGLETEYAPLGIPTTYRKLLDEYDTGVWLVGVYKTTKSGHWVVVDAERKVVVDNGAMVSSVPVRADSDWVRKTFSGYKPCLAVRVLDKGEAGGPKRYKLGKASGKWGKLSADAIKEACGETFTKSEAVKAMGDASAVPNYKTNVAWFKRMVEAKRIIEA